jgi:hypothetical protein
LIIIVTYLFINARFFNYFSLIVQFFVNPILQKSQRLSNTETTPIDSLSIHNENHLDVHLFIKFLQFFPRFSDVVIIASETKENNLYKKAVATMYYCLYNCSL